MNHSDHQAKHPGSNNHVSITSLDDNPSGNSKLPNSNQENSMECDRGMQQMNLEDSVWSGNNMF